MPGISCKGEVLGPFWEGALVQGHADAVLLLHRGIKPALHGSMRAHRFLHSSATAEGILYGLDTGPPG